MRLSKLTAGLLLTAAPAAVAHTGSHPVAGFVSGLTHPLAGADHVLAMMGVGLWAACALPRQMWLLPLVFMVLMATGGMLGTAGLAIPGAESGIAASVLLLGALVAFTAKLSRLHAAALVALFALFHGYAHGQEMSQSADFITYAIGFLTATGLLHLVGIGLGRLAYRVPLLYRGMGGVMSAWGALLLLS